MEFIMKYKLLRLQLKLIFYSNQSSCFIIMSVYSASDISFLFTDVSEFSCKFLAKLDVVAAPAPLPFGCVDLSC